jgi:ketosteroid isomerase-like protein
MRSIRRISAFILIIAAFAGPGLARANKEGCKGKATTAAELVGFERRYEHTLSNEFNSDPMTAMKYYDTSRIRLFDAATSHSDVHGGLEVRPDQFVAHFKELGPAFVGKMEFLDIEASGCGDVGFVSLIQHYRGTTDKGVAFEFFIRSTDGLEKVRGRWKIVHQHWSFPVDLSTQKGQLDSRY